MMNNIIFWLTFSLLTIMIIVFDKKFMMIRDIGTGTPRPYSLSRTIMAWWTVIVFGSFIVILVARGVVPTADISTFYLLSIVWGTIVGATFIDISDQNNPKLTDLGQNMPGSNFWVDILSDKNGINVCRFQTVLINLFFGIWFLSKVFFNVRDAENAPDTVLPYMSINNLLLYGMGSALYLVMKSFENKQKVMQPKPPVIDNEPRP
ncbi:MAG: hypothetical protein JWP37_3474 [Mucilaginibacter sp.]|nr:hypothetical protein [Mucilaginibacter sp.]